MHVIPSSVPERESVSILTAETCELYGIRKWRVGLSEAGEGTSLLLQRQWRQVWMAPDTFKHVGLLD